MNDPQKALNIYIGAFKKATTHKELGTVCLNCMSAVMETLQEVSKDISAEATIAMIAFNFSITEEYIKAYALNRTDDFEIVQARIVSNLELNMIKLGEHNERKTNS